MDGWMDGRTDGETDREIDRQTYRKILNAVAGKECLLVASSLFLARQHPSGPWPPHSPSF